MKTPVEQLRDLLTGYADAVDAMGVDVCGTASKLVVMCDGQSEVFREVWAQMLPETRAATERLRDHASSLLAASNQLFHALNAQASNGSETAHE